MNYFDRLDIKIKTKCPWDKEIITVRAVIKRISNSFLTFKLNGVEYDRFMLMKGTFTCKDETEETHIFTFQSEDLVTILYNDYEKVHEAWLDKCEECRQEVIAQQKAIDEKEIKERLEKAEKEKAEKMKHFWYRIFHHNK